MVIDFADQVVVVTGSGRGIGLAIAETFAQQNASVVLSDYNEAALENAKQHFQEKGYRFSAFPCDVGEAAAGQQMIEKTLEEYGQIHILINNAGITRDNLLLRMKESQWNDVLHTNLTGAFLLTKAITRHFMKQRYGRIINISSVVGITGNAGQSNYAASKAGLIGFSKSVAKELASRNITVNVIAPGFIETQMTEALGDDVKQAFLQNIPLQKAGTPLDIAHVALFLASPLADYLTGQVIHVDGGMVM